MPTISTCLIVKNEKDFIRRCLDSVKLFSDEIIVFDTGSDDGTQYICKEYNNLVLVQGEWHNDFAWARNQSFKYATCDYIFWVDADDFIEKESQEWFLNFKNSELGQYDCVNIGYIYVTDEEGNALDSPFYRERIFKRSLNPQWYSRIHEYCKLNSTDIKVYYSDFNEVIIKHHKHFIDPLRNITIYREMEKNGEITDGRNWFYYARECMWHDDWTVAIENFKKALDCEDLWNIDRLNAYMDMSTLYKEHDMWAKHYECIFLAASCTDYIRADVCCELAEFYNYRGNTSYAKELYKMALDNDKHNDFTNNTFMDPKYSTTIPALMLCLMEFNEGNIEKSKEYNDLALNFDPNNQSALYNKEFFNNL